MYNKNLLVGHSAFKRGKKKGEKEKKKGNIMIEEEPSVLVDVKSISEFVAHRSLSSLDAVKGLNAVVVCGSAVLQTVDCAVEAFKQGVAPLILFTGGVGHSTDLLYDAIRLLPKAQSSQVNLEGKPTEAEVLRDYALTLGAPAGALLIETASRNTGENAALSRVTLEASGIPQPHSLLIIQDPTMQVRALATFQKVYQDVPSVILHSWSPFLPTISYDPPSVVGEALPTGSYLLRLSVRPQAWTTERFLGMLLGEIPRLKDAPGGYGPKGTGYIAHVDVPDAIIEAHERLSQALSLLNASRAICGK